MPSAADAHLRGDVTLTAHGSLTFFLGGDETVVVPVDRQRSIKDAVESAGIPHPEVSTLLVDGASAGFGALLRGGEHVDAFGPDTPVAEVARAARADSALVPVRRSSPPDRFVCDVHLGVLARRLRQLGFDTWYRTQAHDDEIAMVAVEDDRVVLTRDRGLLMRTAVVHGYCPRSDDPREQVLEVVRRFDLAERLAPLSRCTTCNGVLTRVAKAEVLEQLPPRTRSEHDQFSRCTRCGQVYWPGTHLPALEAVVAEARSAGTVL